MSEKELTFEELVSRNEDLQRQAAHSLVIGQNLIDAKDRLDRELSRFRTIQTYSERAIHAGDYEEFTQLTVEAVIETFELECSALLIFSSARSSLKVEAEFGFEELERGQLLEIDWLEAKGHLKRRNAFIEQITSHTHPWANLRLCQMILCPVADGKSNLRGFVLGARSRENQAFYDEMTRELIPSFTVFSQQMSTLLQNFESKEFLEKTVQERTEELSAANIMLIASNEDLEQEIGVRKKTEKRLRAAENEAKELSEFLKKTFGRYISKRVMNTLLENPSALELGGERRSVTMMSSDLRGFTAISENLEPEQVVAMLNAYFEVMMEVIHHYGGTINDVIGDALLVFFGAPQKMPDRTERAIACAIAMQNAMGKVNDTNRLTGLPELEMGIGLHNSEVVVGNIGSRLRTKYSVVGSGVNLVTRIESYTVGGQVLASESVCKKAGDMLRIDGRREVYPKGFALPLKIYEIGGIAGKHNLALDSTESNLVILTHKIPLMYTVLKGKHIGKTDKEGRIIRLSKKQAEILLDEPVEQFSDLKMNLVGVYEELAAKDFYGKVTDNSGMDGTSCLVRFTSIPPEVVSYFLGHEMHAEKRSESMRIEV
jgi:class 3 adenylate cyclase